MRDSNSKLNCEYCGDPLPPPIGKASRQTRSRHCGNCAVRLEQKRVEGEHENDKQQQRYIEWRAEDMRVLLDAGFTPRQAGAIIVLIDRKLTLTLSTEE